MQKAHAQIIYFMEHLIKKLSLVGWSFLCLNLYIFAGLLLVFWSLLLGFLVIFQKTQLTT